MEKITDKLVLTSLLLPVIGVSEELLPHLLEVNTDPKGPDKCRRVSHSSRNTYFHSHIRLCGYVICESQKEYNEYGSCKQE